MSREDRRDELFIVASELPPGDRDAFLEVECGNDTDMIEDILSLLSAEEGAEDFLRSAVAGAADTVLAESDTAVAGREIGPYVVEELIGVGGMGTVYRAVRADEAFTKQVAIKVIRWGSDSPDARARFLAERQILADLEHPYIARMLDGGTLDDGSPYVVMEYVEGQPIDVWADEQQLDVVARVRLFLRICDAVEFAHRNLVVHRDIKPSNILITEDGSPRLIDFGVAKLLDAPSSKGLTRTGTRMLTPEYASPEQLRGEAVTVGTDVYSLGVLLYELLTGRWPFRTDSDDASSRERAVLEATPDPPATVVTRAHPRADEIAASRGSDPLKLRRQLKGDLDTIVLAALRKEPSRRYGTVGELAEDLRRHLAKEPVSARRDSLAYRATRFAQRNWIGVAAASAVLAALAIGSVVAWTGLVQATAAQQRAEASAARADTINAFLTGMLSSIEPDRSRGEVITVREVLDSAAAQLERDAALTGDTEVAAALLFTIGESYLSLGELDASASVFERALEIQDGLYEQTDERVLETNIRLGEIHWQRGDLEASRVSAERVLEIRRATVGTEHQEYGSALLNLGNTWADMGRLDLAEPLVREAMAVDRRTLVGDERWLLSYTLNSLGTILTDTQRPDQAIPIHQEALELRRGARGDTSTVVVTSMTNLSRALIDAERFDDAESMARGAIARAEAILPDDHPRRGHAEVALGLALHRSARPDEAEGHFRTALAIYEAQLGADSWRSAAARGYLGQALLASGRPSEGETALEAAWTGLASALSSEHPTVAAFAADVALLFADLGEPEKAAEWRSRSD